MDFVQVPRLAAVGLALALLTGSALPLAAAGSPDLANASKALKAGKTDAVIKGLSAAMGRFSGADAAKAFFLRGSAYAKSGQHVQAIADLNMALWLKGLGAEQQAEAQRLRAAAFAAVGQSDPGSAGPSVEPVAEAAPAAEGQWGATLAEAPAEQPTASKTKRKKSQPAEADQAPAGETLPWLGTTTSQATASATTADNSAIGSGWQQTAVVAEGTASLPAEAGAASGYFVQVGSVRTTGEAQSIADKVTTEHADLLGGLTPSIAPSSLGNMGTFYLVQLGPLPDERSSLKLCKQLQRKGVDCFMVQR